MDVLSWTFGRLGSPGYRDDKPIFIDASNASFYITAEEARTLVRQMIAGLKAAGLRKGDTVCILTLSSIYYPIFFLAIVGAGGRVAGGNPGHTVHELKHLLRKCSVSFMITEPSLLDKAQSAAADCSVPSKHIFVCDGHSTSTADPQSWRNLLTHGESEWEVFEEAQAATTVSAFYSTSGTTGAPKFAAVSHAYQVTTGKYIESETLSKPYEVSRLVSLPLLHAFAAPMVHTEALRSGTATFIMPRFKPSAFVETIKKYDVTEFPAVPSMLAVLESTDGASAGLAPVREVICAGAPLSAPLAASFSAVLTHPSARLIQLYGATEASWISSTPYRQAKNFPHAVAFTIARAANPAVELQAGPTPTVGTALPGYRIRLIDTATGREIAASNVPGAVEVSAPHAFLYYIDADQATRDSFTPDGWLRTGDIATRDDDGRFYIVDREKDMIKVRGWQVAPSEIEAALADHPAIQDCAVLGTEDRRGSSGEIPIAFVSLKRPSMASISESDDAASSTADRKDSLVDEDALKTFLRERLAGYKVPEQIQIITSIPRNPAGKILRRTLREFHMPDQHTAVSAVSDSSSQPPAAAHSPLNNGLLAPTTVPAASSLPIGAVVPTPLVEKALSHVLPGSALHEQPKRSLSIASTAVSADSDGESLSLTGTVQGGEDEHHHHGGSKQEASSEGTAWSATTGTIGAIGTKVAADCRRVPRGDLLRGMQVVAGKLGWLTLLPVGLGLGYLVWQGTSWADEVKRLVAVLSR